MAGKSRYIFFKPKTVTLPFKGRWRSGGEIEVYQGVRPATERLPFEHVFDPEGAVPMSVVRRQDLAKAVLRTSAEC